MEARGSGRDGWSFWGSTGLAEAGGRKWEKGAQGGEDRAGHLDSQTPSWEESSSSKSEFPRPQQFSASIENLALSAHQVEPFA